MEYELECRMVDILRRCSYGCGVESEGWRQRAEPAVGLVFEVGDCIFDVGI